MIDVIVYKPSPYGLVFIHDKPLGFIIYHIKHERVYVSYKPLMQNCPLGRFIKNFFLQIIRSICLKVDPGIQ